MSFFFCVSYKSSRYHLSKNGLGAWLLVQHKKKKTTVEDLHKTVATLPRQLHYSNQFTEFPPRCTGVYFGTPQYFSRKNLDFYRDSGCTKVHPEKNGVLEVVDDPPWSCDPTVQSVWLAVSKEVEEKGGKI